MKILCPNCKMENPGFALTCRHCGTNLTGVVRTDNLGRSSHVPRIDNRRGTAELVAPKATTSLSPRPMISANQSKTATSANQSARPTTAEWIECPTCKVDNSRSKLTCWHCGESLIGVERTANYPVESSPTPTTPAWERTIPPPEKPVSLLQLVFSVGIFFLIILVGSVIFQELHTISRIIYIAGMISGFGYLYFKNLPEASTSAEAGENSSGDPFPEWLTLLVGIPFMIILLALLLAVMFGAGLLLKFVGELVISKEGAERILALVLGAGLGVIIELSLANLLRAVTHLRLS